MIYAKKRKLKIVHLNGISANFYCFIIGDLSLPLPEPVTFGILGLPKGILTIYSVKQCKI